MRTEESSQNEIKVSLNHLFNGDTFVLNRVFKTLNNEYVEFSEVKFYLSSLSCLDEELNNVQLENTIYLITPFSNELNLGYSSVNHIDELSFDLGLDTGLNFLSLTQKGDYSPDHPLSSGNQDMYWSEEEGHKFMLFKGKVDLNEDGTPETDFQYEIGGENLHQNIKLESHVTPFEGEKIDLIIDYSRFFLDVNIKENLYELRDAELSKKIMLNSNYVFSVRLEEHEH